MRKLHKASVSFLQLKRCDQNRATIAKAKFRRNIANFVHLARVVSPKFKAPNDLFDSSIFMYMCAYQYIIAIIVSLVISND